MEKLDELFEKFLSFLEADLSGDETVKPAYSPDRSSDLLWEKGTALLREGLCEQSMRAMLEFEKQKLLRNKDLDEKELLEVIVMEKLVYCLYCGDRCQIADMTQNFASQNIYRKHSAMLEAFRQEEKTPCAGAEVELTLFADSKR